LKTLIQHDDDLTSKCSWSENGFVVSSLFESNTDYLQLVDVFKQLIKNNLETTGYVVGSDFSPEKYHHILKKDAEHYAFINKMGNFYPAQLLGSLLEKLENRISEICKTEVHAKHPDYDEKIFNIRIVRPKSKDNNPLHRDVWLDRLRNAINIYVPIAGSNELSSLPLIPGSHHWPDDELERTEKGAEVEGRAYTVPSVIKINKDYEIIRPNPQENEVLVFSPYLIHGGASNLNDDLTRISLEMRFWRK
jgi:hypothetical protein